jgi:hypothetical protein
MARPLDARPLGELFSDLTRDITTLIRSEIAPARTELSQTASRIGRHAVIIAGGAILACGGLCTVLAAATCCSFVRASRHGWRRCSSASRP